MKLLSQPMLALLLDQDQRVGYLLLAGPYGGLWLCLSGLVRWLLRLVAPQDLLVRMELLVHPARRATETTGSTCASTPGYDYQYGSVRSAVSQYL